eukprot:939623-Prymnesium_polylepis.1
MIALRPARMIFSLTMLNWDPTAQSVEVAGALQPSPAAAAAAMGDEAALYDDEFDDFEDDEPTTDEYRVAQDKAALADRKKEYAEAAEAIAATKMQAIQRGNAARSSLGTRKRQYREAAEEKVALAERKQEYMQAAEDIAATKLQAVQRGNTARAGLKAEAAGAAEVDSAAADAKMRAEAATKVQAVMRGKRAREEVATVKQLSKEELQAYMATRSKEQVGRGSTAGLNAFLKDLKVAGGASGDGRRAGLRRRCRGEAATIGWRGQSESA